MATKEFALYLTESERDKHSVALCKFLRKAKWYILAVRQIESLTRTIVQDNKLSKDAIIATYVLKECHILVRDAIDEYRREYGYDNITYSGIFEFKDKVAMSRRLTDSIVKKIYG